MKLHPSVLLRTMIGLALTAIQSPAQSTYEPYTFTTLAGTGPGSADGIGSTARFNHPSGVAVDGSGNVYVADTDNHTIRKVTQAGVVTTLAGLAGYAGSTDGSGSAARFGSAACCFLSGVAVDSAGNVYVADAGNNEIRKVTVTGVVTTLAGLAQLDADGYPVGGSADGTGSAARFNHPQGVAVDSAGNVYVADSYNATIRKITPTGTVTTLAGLAGQSGEFMDGTGNAARFWEPLGVAVDIAGNVYVADHLVGDDGGQLRKVTPQGVVTTLGGAGGWGVAVDSEGNVYVSSCSHAATICKMTPTGEVTSLDNAGLGAVGLAVDSAGNLYVSDSGNHTILKMTLAGVVTTLAGLAGSPGSADGMGSAASFNSPTGVAVDTAGNLYVTDYLNDTIRKVTPTGVVTTLAGLAGAPGSADGTGSAVRFSYPNGVAVDSAGNLYVADTGNETIRKAMLVGTNWVVTTLAGLAQFDTNGIPVGGSADGTGSDARFRSPTGVAVDSAGNVYVAEILNNTIRKVTPNGAVTTLAGLAGSRGSTDGTGSDARFFGPNGVAVDSAGNVYVADYENYTIRKVTPAGVVTTLAGLARSPGSADGTGSAARFDNPLGIAVDSAGNVYVGEGNNTIRKVTPAGVVTTLAGLAGSAGGADGTGNAARFGYPLGVAVDTTGNVYVADYGDNTIRKGYPTLSITSSGPSFGFNGGQFGFNITGPTGKLLVVEASTDLVSWLPVRTNTIAGALHFSDPQSGVYSKSFYRAVSP